MANLSEPARVFIVEDNDPDVFLVEEAMRSVGIAARMQRCYDGEEAIHLLSQIGESALPHVIIIDLNLPKVTGLQILKHVRALKHLDRVPVLILTSSQSKNDRALSLQLGADAYIPKPPTLPEFLSAVGSGLRALLERSGAQAGARLLQFEPPCVSLRSRRRTQKNRMLTHAGSEAFCNRRRMRSRLPGFGPARRSTGSRRKTILAL
jgi:DNA-binding response OmpR family regulator